MFAHILSNLFVRPLAEKAFRNAFDKSTPGRIASILQGLTCTIMIMQRQWKEAISVTLAFFLLDLIFEEIYRLPRHLEMKIHHVIGAILCAASLYYRTYELKEVGSGLTYALIALEACNPLLHALIIFKKEKQLHRFSTNLKKILKFTLIAQFFIIRVLWLGYAFIRFVYNYNWSHYQSSLIFLAGALWLMQIYWLLKLLKNSKDD